jgi:putative peptide zinc metalloprotease protein
VATASSSPAISAAAAVPAAPAPRQPAAPDYAKLVVTPLRGDLITSEQVYLGRAYVIIKNPISLTYFRLSRAHYDAACRYDGKTPLGAIAPGLQQANAYWRALPLEQAIEELVQLANQLSATGVLQGSGHQALKRINATQVRRTQFRLESVVASILYIRKSLIDPNRLLGRLDRYFGWMYTRAYVLAFFGCGLITLLLLAGHWAELAVHGANFFTLQNLALTWVVFIFVKTIHEFGHGLTCKHFGGEVHEMGALLIMFTPFLYCNVSDSWLLPDKKRRILVTAAGIFIEMTLAIIASWVWLATAPGLLHQISFNIMFTCSITTLLFNANPLMKYDGYYMLSDALEVPNLKQKSNAAATGWAQRYLLGLHRGGPAQFFSYELSPLFGLYAIASYFYGWWVLYRISGRMFDMLAPYGLDFLSHSYVWLYLFTALALPSYRLMRVTYQNPTTRVAANRRFLQIGAVLAVLLAASWFVPWEATIKRGVVIDNAVVETIAARTPGFLREVYVHDGDRVRAGQALARLDNPDLQTDIDEFTREADTYEVQRRGALSDLNETARGAAAAYGKLAQEALLQAQLRQWQQGECTLRATHDGVVREQHLNNLVGQFFPRGRKFCEIGSADEYRAIISLDEGEARRVRAGQPAWMRLRALSRETFSGTITSAPVSSLTRLTNSGSANVTGGDVPTQVNHEGMLEPSVAYYEAEMLVRDTGGEHLRSGLTGMARIDVGRTTLGKHLCSSVLDLINPAIRL